jgi:hypothetical protein
VPGTLNPGSPPNKPQPAVCRLIEVNPEAVSDLSNWDKLLPNVAFSQARSAKGTVDAFVDESIKTEVQPQTPTATDDKVERCRQLLAKMPRSIQGKNGSLACFNAARLIFRDFAMGRREGMTLLRWYNQYFCDPAWSELELEHKADDALKDGSPYEYQETEPPKANCNNAGKKPNEASGHSENGQSSRSQCRGKKRIIERCLKDVSRKVIEWLWPNYIPRGMITLFDGDPDQGKTFVTLDLAARVSRGWPMPPAPPGSVTDPGHVIVMSAEDSLEQTIKERLDALGADQSRIIYIEAVTDNPDDPEASQPLVLPDDLALLEERIKAHSAKLVIIDPFSAWISGKYDANKDSDVRKILHRIKLVAERTGAVFIIVRHLNKVSKESNPMYRGGGSIGIIGAARAAFLFASDSGEPRSERHIFARIKGNLCPVPPSLAYRIEPSGLSAVVRWEGEVDITAADLLATFTMQSGAEKVGRAVRFLAKKLSSEPVAAVTLFEEALKEDISKGTLRRAKRFLGVKAKKSEGSGQWFWSLLEE